MLRLILLLIALPLLALTFLWVVSAVEQSAPPGRPNVVVIVTDDQRWDTLDAMPVLGSLQARVFANAFATTPLCCPSRATILTGQYAHTHGIRTNEPPDGGVTLFQDAETLPVWLQRAGYRTALVGKYLNDYRGDFIPPGWDRWFGLAGDRYTWLRFNDDGLLFERGAPDEEVYTTDVLFEQAERWIRGADDRPIFLLVTPYAPHSEAIPAPRHQALFADLAPLRPPSYDERDVADKPQWVQALPPLEDETRARVDQFRRQQYQTLAAVDEGIARLLAALDETGQRQNTAIVFLSDNGYMLGEHRGYHFKACAYAECARVPLLISYPPLTPERVSDDRIALNLDLAPTILELAGVPVPPTVQGASLAPLLRGEDPPWRSDTLIEAWHQEPYGSPSPGFAAVRSHQWSYVEYETGEVELYHLEQDPYELHNLAGRSEVAQQQAQLRDRLAELRGTTPAP